MQKQQLSLCGGSTRQTVYHKAQPEEMELETTAEQTGSLIPGATKIPCSHFLVKSKDDPLMYLNKHTVSQLLPAPDFIHAIWERSESNNEKNNNPPPKKSKKKKPTQKTGKDSSGRKQRRSAACPNKHMTLWQGVTFERGDVNALLNTTSTRNQSCTGLTTTTKKKQHTKTSQQIQAENDGVKIKSTSQCWTESTTLAAKFHQVRKLSEIK